MRITTNEREQIKIFLWKQPYITISAGLNLDIDDAGNYVCQAEKEGEPILHTNQLKNLGIINPLLILFAPLFSANLPPS